MSSSSGSDNLDHDSSDFEFVKRSLKFATTTIVIEDFRRRKERQGVPIISPSFSVGDENSNDQKGQTSFKAFFYPNGTDDTEQTGFFLAVDESDYDTVKARFAVSILDKHGEVKVKKVCPVMVRGINNKAGWAKFYPRRKFLDSLQQILKNGTVSFVVDVYFIEEDIPGEQLNSIFNLSSLFTPKTKSGSEEFKELFEYKQFDIALKLKDRSIPAHRVVLATSLVIEKYLIRDRRTFYPIDDFDYDVVADAVYFMYHHSFESETPNYRNLLKFADAYKIHALKFACEQELYETVSLDNLLDLYRVAHSCNSPLLINSLKFVIKDNIVGVTETKGWFDLLANDPGLVTNIVRFLASDTKENGNGISSRMMTKV
jgi:hypothetical protein